jgi:predicted DNA-binding protein (MmcQ/YjbR family)
MHVEELHEYCLSLKGATESFPFDEYTLVFKVAGRMFAVIPLEKTDLQITLKCDPEKAIELREKYTCVEPAFHFNKKCWNTIYLNSGMSDEQVKHWICHSIEQMMQKQPKRVKEEYYRV